MRGFAGMKRESPLALARAARSAAVVVGLDLRAEFEACAGEFRQFDRIQRPLHARPEICALLMLDRMMLAPNGSLMRASTEGMVTLAVDCREFAGVATPSQVRDLARCGVTYIAQQDSLALVL